MSGISSDLGLMRAAIADASLLVNSEGASSSELEEVLVSLGKLQSGPLARVISFSLKGKDIPLQVEVERFASLLERFIFDIQNLWIIDFASNDGLFSRLLDFSYSQMTGITHISPSQTKIALTHFIFVRHGETHRNKEGKEIQGWVNDDKALLNATGQNQAEKLGEKIGEIYKGTIQHIYSSPLMRCEETARRVARYLDNPSLIFDPRLKEIGHGRWECFSYQKRNEMGQAFYEKIRKEGKSTDRFREWKINPLAHTDVEPPAQRDEKAFESKLETVREVFERSIAALKEIAKKHPGETILIVTHAGVITTLIDEAVYRERNDTNPMPVYYLSPTKIGNCSVAHLTWEDEETHFLEIKDL